MNVCVTSQVALKSFLSEKQKTGAEILCVAHVKNNPNSLQVGE